MVSIKTPTEILIDSIVLDNSPAPIVRKVVRTLVMRLHPGLTEEEIAKEVEAVYDTHGAYPGEEEEEKEVTVQFEARKLQGSEAPASTVEDESTKTGEMKTLTGTAKTAISDSTAGKSSSSTELAEGYRDVREELRLESGRLLGDLRYKGFSEWNVDELRTFNVWVHDDELEVFMKRLYYNGPLPTRYLEQISKAFMDQVTFDKVVKTDDDDWLYQEKLNSFGWSFHSNLQLLLKKPEFYKVALAMVEAGTATDEQKRQVESLSGKPHDVLPSADAINDLVHDERGICRNLADPEPPSEPKKVPEKVSKKASFSMEPAGSSSFDPFTKSSSNPLTEPAPLKPSLKQPAHQRGYSVTSLPSPGTSAKESTTNLVLVELIKVAGLNKNLFFTPDERDLTLFVGYRDKKTNQLLTNYVQGKNDGSIFINEYHPDQQHKPDIEVPLINIESKRFRVISPRDKITLCAQIFAESLAIVQERDRFCRSSDETVTYLGQKYHRQVYTISIQGKHARLFFIEFSANYLLGIQQGKIKDKAHLHMTREFRLDKARDARTFARMLLWLFEQTGDDVLRDRLVFISFAHYKMDYS